MIQDRFQLLLQDLSKQLKIEMKPDSNNSCMLGIKDQLEVQLEMDPNHDHILVIGSKLAELSPGKFREEMLLAALSANARPYPRIGSFSYSTKLNSLILHMSIDLDHFSADHVLRTLTPFIHKAYTWKKAIETGDVTRNLIETDFTNSNAGNPFEL